MLLNSVKQSISLFTRLSTRAVHTAQADAHGHESHSSESKQDTKCETISNKRITRLQSDIQLEDSGPFKSQILNRNPRNLEQLAFEAKPKGFWLDKSAPTDWNKLVLEQDGRHLSAYLRHWSGKNLIQASTRESELKKYFKSPNTMMSARILAQVIARRCLQAGYIVAGYDQQAGQKTEAFYESIREAGLHLKEPPEITPRCVTDL